MNPPTVQDVARQAGVSAATVSRVLNGSPRVSPEAETRVRDAVRALKYQPNRSAQRLRAGRSRVIGLVISDIQNPFFTAVVGGIEDAADEKGYSVLLSNSKDDPQRESFHLDVMKAEAVAGVILTSTAESSPHVSGLLEQGIPVVALDRVIKRYRIDSVRVDNETGVHQAISHLSGLGHRQIGFVGLPLNYSVGIERHAGYRRALAEYHIPYSSRRIRIGDAKERGGYVQTLDLLQAEPTLTALFVANNLMGLGALHALKELSKSVPEDISLVCFDEMPFSSLLRPPLTTVAQPIYDLGIAAARLLFERLERPDKPVTHLQLKPTLIVRGSTQPPSPRQGLRAARVDGGRRQGGET